MMLFFWIIAAMLGACVGSFCNVLIVRMYEGESMGGRSHCMHCRAVLKARYLVPIFSWGWLRGKCADCGGSIHWQYPAVEIAGALIGVLSFAAAIEHGPALALWHEGVFVFGFLFALLVVTAFDLRWQMVPIVFSVAAAVTLGVWNVLFGGFETAISVVIGALGSAAVLGLIVLISRGTMMGEGDPVIGFLIGAGLGSPLAFIALYIAFIIGGAVSAALLLTGRVSRKTPVPFVPFLAIGAVVAYWWRIPLLMQLTYVFG